MQRPKLPRYHWKNRSVELVNIYEWPLTCIKVSLLRAADFWRTVAIPEKGIPAIKTSDGPNGARGGIFTGGTKVGLPFSNFGYLLISARQLCFLAVSR